MASGTTRVSTTSSSEQADGASYVGNYSYAYGQPVQQAQVYSHDGSEIVFTTSAENLSGGQSVGVILKNLQTGQETAVYAAPGAVTVSQAQFTRDGQSVIFQNQFRSGGSSIPGFIVKNLTTGATHSISGSSSISGISVLAASDDGSRVAFSEQLYNANTGSYYQQDYVANFNSGTLKVGPAQTNRQVFPVQFDHFLNSAMYSASLKSDNGFTQIHLENLNTGGVSVVSATAGKVEGNAASSGGFLSQDGTKAVFSTTSTNLAASASQGGVFLKNLNTGALSVVAANSGSASTYVTDTAKGLSADGNKVAILYDSYATGARKATDTYQLQIADLSSGTTKTVTPQLTLTQTKSSGTTTSTDGMQFGQTVFSPDGTKLAYVEDTIHSAPGSFSVSSQLFVYDSKTNTTTTVSQPTANQNSSDIFNVVFSPDGSQIAYSMRSGNTTVYDLASGQSVTVPTNNGVFFAPDSKSFAYASTDPNQVGGDTNNASDVFTSSVCFASGTRIRTARGDVAVEALEVGDLAVTASGLSRPIRWLGHRTIDCRRHPRPHDVMPIRVAAHAFGPASPERDLYLSPGHPVLVGGDEDGNGGHLVPIMCLINGTTIERTMVDEVTYWHVELDEHDILLAEGLAAESYIDLGSRSWFGGANDPLGDPDLLLAGQPGRCRPVAIDGPIVEAEHRRLDAVFATRLAGACMWPDELSAFG